MPHCEVGDVLCCVALQGRSRQMRESKMAGTHGERRRPPDCSVRGSAEEEEEELWSSTHTKHCCCISLSERREEVHGEGRDENTKVGQSACCLRVDGKSKLSQRDHIG